MFNYHKMLGARNPQFAKQPLLYRKTLLPKLSNQTFCKILVQNTMGSFFILVFKFKVRNSHSIDLYEISNIWIKWIAPLHHALFPLYLQGASIGEPVTVVCNCSLGYRSSALAQQLAYELDKPVHQELKSKTVIYNLEGSIFKWANEGKDLEDNKGRKTVYVHPYNIVWGKLLNAELRSSEPCESRQETAMQTSLTEAKM